MTSAPCPAHPKARFQHFCGECGKPTSSFGREMLVLQTQQKVREESGHTSSLRGEARSPVVRFHNEAMCKGGNECIIIEIDNLAIRVRTRDIRRAHELAGQRKLFMIDARSIEPISPGTRHLRLTPQMVGG